MSRLVTVLTTDNLYFMQQFNFLKTKMIQVYVWLPEGGQVGHTAMFVKSEYISFWPQGGADKKDLKLKRSQPGEFMESLGADITNEGGRQPIVIELHHLDDDAVLAHFVIIQAEGPRYQIMRHNCSHVIAHCLMAGGGTPSFTPNAGHYGNLARILGIGVWTPDQILKFVNEMKLL
jgi:hypothetical protein